MSTDKPTGEPIPLEEHQAELGFMVDQLRMTFRAYVELVVPPLDDDVVADWLAYFDRLDAKVDRMTEATRDIDDYDIRSAVARNLEKFHR